MSIKKSAALAGGIALSLVAGGAFAADPVTLNVWSDTPRLDMFELYGKTHDNVKLNVTTVAPENLIAKIQLAMQAKSEIPDVIFMADIGYTAELSTRRSNYLMDLTDKVPQALQDEFFPNGNSPCHVNGKLLCLRNDLAHDIVWYDKSAMDALGKQLPTTWKGSSSSARSSPHRAMCSAAVSNPVCCRPSSSPMAAISACRWPARTTRSRSTLAPTSA